MSDRFPSTVGKLLQFEQMCELTVSFTSSITFVPLIRLMAVSSCKF